MTYKILHINSAAGVSQILSKYQKKISLKSTVVSFESDPFSFNQVDYRFLPKTLLTSQFEKVYKLFQISFSDYNIFHFHGRSLFLRGLDLPLWKIRGKSIILHFHGTYLRKRGQNILYENLTKHTLVSTPDLLRYAPNATWVPNPVDLETMKYIGIKESDKPIHIVHAPTTLGPKGTKYVIDSVNKLKEEGYNIQLTLLNRIPHLKVVEIFKTADIVVDQLLTGWYGMVAIECMALGKPICCYIDERLESYMPFMPMINSNPQSIYNDLKNLIEDINLRIEIGKKGRRYVETLHNPVKIVEMINTLY